MNICRALFKDGYSNFSLIILEYCSPDKCLIREKHYWDLLNPEYNIAKDPTAPFSGRKHSDETKQILSEANKGKNHPNYGKTLSDETKQIMSDTKKGEKNPMHGKPKPSGAGNSSQEIEVTDIKNNTTTSYDSIRAAARALNIRNSSIDMYFF
jgi:group I intron endonuclease